METQEVNRDIQGIEDKKAKSHKGRRHLDLYKPKLNEEPKQCLVLKGNKTSERVTKALDCFVSLFANKGQYQTKLERQVPKTQ